MTEINLQKFLLGQLNNENVVVLFSYVYVRRETISSLLCLHITCIASWRYALLLLSHFRLSSAEEESRKKITSMQTNTCQLSNAGHFLLAKTTQRAAFHLPSLSLFYLSLSAFPLLHYFILSFCAF